MTQVITDADADALADAAHALKGSAANVGARAVSRLAGQLEELRDAADLDAAGPLLDALRDAFRRTRSALESARREHSP